VPIPVFDRVLGQAPAVETLTRALERGRVHHAYRFEGPDGVGKEAAAFALAQALVCERGNGCGECSACRRAVRFPEDEPRVPQHPDVVLLQRGLYPPSALGTSSRESIAIGVEQIRRLVIARVGFSPHEGRAMVFIVRDAHELSVPAANALLKVLEEPPSRVHFVLLTSQPKRLLDTIRSRTLAVRFGPLPESVVRSILEASGKSPDFARAAQGSASAALALASDDDQRERTEFVDNALSATAAPELDAAIAFAATRPEDRDTLLGHLTELAQRFAVIARERVPTDPAAAEVAARRYAVVEEAKAAIERNAQPALSLEAMVSRLRAAS
jgi:DNA polymerase-3 subunit delta'